MFQSQSGKDLQMRAAMGRFPTKKRLCTVVLPGTIAPQRDSFIGIALESESERDC